MKSKIILVSALILIAFTFFVSCSSNEGIQESIAITSEDIVADADIDGAVDDVSNVAEDQYAIQQSLTLKTTQSVKSILPACATITIVVTNDTWTRTIDFGTEGCTLQNGNLVKGKITVSASRNFSELTKSISISFVKFYHNNKLIEGSRTITSTVKTSDLLSTAHPVFTNSIDMTVTFADGRKYSRIGTRVRELVEGIDTKFLLEDNVYLVWGYHITTFPNGSKFTATIKTPLRFVMACELPFPVSGTKNFIKTDKDGLNKKEGLIDFGKGECDDLATITINGETREIHLKK
ncbi:hypothetical protein H8R23_01095 [Flavobacterium sp. F-380]|uniref:Lipoprotein n=1 Tax=Flavobacterium kayseriense TaxID=2764714 RepID=A0ABR7J352_9FLAO|nr:hypothetical protein [Flavobacterium kayseriense]MBC5839990.1 hypothetical protein [Flavobacterium kayseriense]MBC5847340.1 hypothetical protein [Flavobacterium kayseriense]